ncbi:MAG: hypothetical protein ACRDRQ_14320, partial [Pseudonocardiaceae bacterium]
PAPFAGACAARVRRRTGDVPSLRCTGDSYQAPGQRDPAFIRTNVDSGGRSGNDGATGAALHSVGSGVG